MARFTVNLYPLAFRRRYGDELLALLEQAPVRLHTLLDLLLGALGAHLRPYDGLTSALSIGERLRASTSGVLACWVIFAAAGFGFYKATEDPPFSGAERTHPLLGSAHAAIQVVATVASLAVILGALPLIARAVAQSRRDRSLRTLVRLPFIAVIAFAGLSAVLILIAHSLPPRPPQHASAFGHGAFIVWLLAAAACGTVCVLASRRALFAMPVSERRLLAALTSGTVVTAGMIAIVLATALYAIALQLDAPQLAASPNGPFGGTPTKLALAGQLIVMLITGTLATITTYRGWRTLAPDPA